MLTSFNAIYKKYGKTHETLPNATAVTEVKQSGGGVIIGTVRNPFAYYVSLWAYGCAKKGGLFQNLCKRFPDEIGTLYVDGLPQTFCRWLRFVMDLKPNRFGLITNRFVRSYCLRDHTALCDSSKIIVDRMLRTESLASDLETAMRDAGFKSYLFDHGTKRNASEYDHYSRYYDDETIDLVRQIDTDLLLLYGYIFE